MLATSHALAAGIILKTIPDPKIALPLALASHFALDLIPHWDFAYNNNRPSQALTLKNEKNHLQLAFYAGLDVIFGFVLTLFLFRDLNPLLLSTTIFFAQLPDWIEMPYYFFGLQLKPSIWAKKMQKRIHSRAALPWGLVSQIVVIVPLLWWVISK